MISLSDFLSLIKDTNRTLYVSSKKGSSSPYILSKVFEKLGKSLLVIVPEDRTIDDFCEELRFFGKDVYKIPSLDVPPYSELFHNKEIIGERNASLFRLLNKEVAIYVASGKSIVEPVIPRNILKKNYIYLLKDEFLEFEELKKSLAGLGYERVEHVELIGDYNVKGGIIDVFSPYHENPLRIEFFGDQIESIRMFDIVTQRSIGELDEGFILPVRNILLEGDISNIHEKIKDYSDQREIPKKIRDEFYEKLVSKKIIPAENFFVNFLYDDETGILSYLDNLDIICLNPEEIISNLKGHIKNLEKQHESVKNRMFVLAPKDIYNLDKLEKLIVDSKIVLGSVSHSEEIVLDFEDNFPLLNYARELGNEKDRTNHPIENFLNFIENDKDNFKILIVTAHQQQAKKIADLIAHYYLNTPEILNGFKEFKEKGVKGKIYVISGPIKRGFRNFSDAVWIITEEEIFGKTEGDRKPKKEKKDLSSIISDLYELNVGDLIVHIEYGIGIYKGLKQVEVLGKKGEYIEIEYADNDKLFVPVEKIGLLQKYIASEDYTAKIDKLGDKRWQKTKKKIKEDLKNWAEEIIKVEALRKSQKGFSFKVDPIALEEFEASFEFEETEDQLRAIEETLKDMESEKPMDRLICGDVGFGKTEVALRAAFVAVSNGKQVCLIAPTTILAEQHFKVFKRRVAPFGFQVALISRFVDKGEQKKILEELKKGEIDIIIGTHRLLGKDVQFSDLGLLIIDEEHKFGVTHKEKIKSFKATVDILTLTATPIPRTMYMSISGLKDISIIVSPPKGRQAIKTFVTKFSESIIRDAVERELQRGGQVFFIHNRVRGIGSMKKYLERILPDVRIMIGHGQMDEQDLKSVMELFSAGRADILLSTAIVESGLDLPNVNTIIVNRADKFGLADLYQLRGRVGRSNRKAYAYFLIPSFESITKDALKRLKILQEMEELGSGFRLAIHDLEIRGAGDLLGKKQSGHINEVGLELYTQLLEEAVREVKFERGELVEEKKKILTEVKLPFPAYIPEWYMESSRERMEFYRRILNSKSIQEVFTIKEELDDRYGKIPQELEAFLYLKELELDLSTIGCVECYYHEDKIVITFDFEYIPPKNIINRILKDISGSRFVVPNKFYFSLHAFKDKNIEVVKKILQAFLERVKIK
ncbi:MAG: transcription-repair coupling factor [Proteobacteria bacterium]|nr:transcription-repair coupling factor [Pseudomonadota bacterium]